MIIATSGYTGSKVRTAYYDSVNTWLPGHAESVQVTFDPLRVSYGLLRHTFLFVAYNPTELNRQGPDYGTQYRSASFPLSASQGKIAKAYLAELNQSHRFSASPVTTIEENTTFYFAENDYQNFLNNHTDHSYIVVNDLPKLQQLKKSFPAPWSNAPVLVKG